MSIRKAGAETLRVVSPAIIVLTNAEGVALFENIDPARYDGEVTVDAVVTHFTKEVDTGVGARITVEVNG